MKGKVQGGHKSDRSKMLHILSEKKRRAFYETQIGKMDQVLFESAVTGGMMEGFTRNYVKVKSAYDPLWVNSEVNGFLNHIDTDGVVAFSEFPETKPIEEKISSIPVLV
jgi:threonylcarbamoyladenosine tRNA methylthiotransferase MtaB